MPGVPSGQGCDACRTQKRRSVLSRSHSHPLNALKCDQTKPACSRCRRLHIICVGSGTQRYLFKSQTTITQKSSEKVTVTRQRPLVLVNDTSISQIPSNGITLLIKAFIEKMEVKDIKFDLSFSCGPFLEEIPKRLGTSEALEAATSAFTKAYQYHHNPCRTDEMLSSYIRAIKALRITFNDPTKACTADSLCALYLIWICQVRKVLSYPSCMILTAVRAGLACETTPQRATGRV